MANEQTPTGDEQAYQGPRPPTPTFYALQAQAMVSDLEGIVDAASELVKGNDRQAAQAEAELAIAQVLTQAATAAAILDLAHAVRQHGAAVFQAVSSAPKKQGSSILQV